jgi:hypothetical protein
MLSAFFSRNEPNARAKISDDFTPLKTRIKVFANPVCAMQRFHFMRENFPRANLEKTFARTRRDAREAAKILLSFRAKISLF